MGVNMTIKNELRLEPKKLKKCCSLDAYTFETTKDLDNMVGIIGQDRAREALDVGLNIKKKGFNIFVAGQWGSGRTTFVYEYAKAIAKDEAVPKDIIYAKEVITYKKQYSNEPNK